MTPDHVITFVATVVASLGAWRWVVSRPVGKVREGKVGNLIVTPKMYKLTIQKFDQLTCLRHRSKPWPLSGIHPGCPPC